MNITQIFVRGILPLLVMGAGVAAAVTMVNSKPEAQKKPRVDRGLLVEVQVMNQANHRVQVRAQGTVVAAYEVGVAAEIGGRVIWKNPELSIGGQVQKGDPLLKIDKRDYRLAVAQQQAALARAQAELELELGRKRVAEREWKLFGKVDAGAPTLAKREPQLKTAKLGLDTAQSSLSQAKLKLDRTVVRAPFNAVVRSNDTEVGRLVAPQQAVAQLVNTDLYTVVVSLPVEDLQWLRVPGMNRPVLNQSEVAELVRNGPNRSAVEQTTTFATITQQVGNGEIVRNGFVSRMLGDLDPVGRMARLLVAITDPLGLARESHAEGVTGLPLMLGAYVHVSLNGVELPDLFELSRSALRGGDHVYVMTADNKLDIRDVQVVRRRRESVLVKAGLSPGDRVVTSTMSSAVQGMTLRLAEESSRNPEGGKRGGGVTP